MPPAFELRTAVASDVDAIADLHAASWRQTYRQALSATYLAGDIVGDRRRLWHGRLARPDERQRVVVAHHGDAVVGFGCLYAGADETWGSLLDNLHVTRALHREGIGTSLLAALARHASQSAPSAGLFLWVLQDNLSAQRFYERHGARNVGTDTWHAPGGTRVPRFRYAWPVGGLTSFGASTPASPR